MDRWITEANGRCEWPLMKRRTSFVHVRRTRTSLPSSRTIYDDNRWAARSHHNRIAQAERGVRESAAPFTSQTTHRSRALPSPSQPPLRLDNFRLLVAPSIEKWRQSTRPSTCNNPTQQTRQNVKKMLVHDVQTRRRRRRRRIGKLAVSPVPRIGRNAAEQSQ